MSLLVKIKNSIVGMCLMLGLTSVVKAQEPPSAFPKISFTYDFNTLFSDDDAYGPRIQVFSNHHFFGNEIKKRNSTKNTLAYAYGLGLGFYSVQLLKEKGDDDYMYHLYAMLILSYRNKSYFEPFAGIYPGFNWGAKTGAFICPTVGVNITTFHINRNWNSKFLQVYTQLSAQYNTSLSCMFIGGGLVLQFQ